MTVTIKATTISGTKAGLTITCDSPDASIYYTLDGSDPSASSLLYSEVLEYPYTKTVRAIAISSGETSEIAEYECLDLCMTSELGALFRHGQERAVISSRVDLVVAYTPRCDIYISPTGALRNGGIYLNGENRIFPMGLDMDTVLKNSTLYQPAEGQIFFSSVSNVYKMYSDGIWKVLSLSPYGSTTGRPTLKVNDRGYTMFDETLRKPIWWTGTKWVDATGADA